jgi:protein tyrosine phosphatase
MAFERGTIYIFLGEIMIDRCNGCNVTTFIMVDTLLNMFNYHENLMVDTTSLSTHVKFVVTELRKAPSGSFGDLPARHV